MGMMKGESKLGHEILWLCFEAGEELCTQLERFIEKERINKVSRILGNRIADRICRRWETALHGAFADPAMCHEYYGTYRNKEKGK